MSNCIWKEKLILYIFPKINDEVDMYKHAIANHIPDNDAARVATLGRYQVFNNEPEPLFEKICALACSMFNVRIAHISFLDANNELIKANVGLDERLFLVDRSLSLCALTVLNESITLIPDTFEDDRLIGHPYIYGDFSLRFYAGVPIFSNDGFVIGTICIIDKVPRTLNAIEIEQLISLAGIVTEQLEMRLENIENTATLKAANARLFESEQRLVGILDTMADGVCIVDAKGKTVYINQMAQHIFEVTLEDMQSRKYNDALWQNVNLDGSILPIEAHPMYIMLNTSLPVFDQEIGILRPGRDVLYISVNAAPLFNEFNELSGGVCTFIDVTTRRNLMNEKDDFISIASHELKTPITTLRASLQLMEKIRDDFASPRFSKLIDQANRSMDKLNGLVLNLLDVNSISAGQLQLHKTVFKLADMISDCCNHIGLEGAYEIRTTGDLTLQVEADEHRINQVVVNLVNNAIKYAPESKVVDIHLSKVGDFARIAVQDQGKGVSSEKIPHLFDRYYRSEYKELHYSGLGLGLFISADIVRKHGGEIGVQSEKGAGANFWFTIPLFQHQ
ncbi:ATP-binding protein [Pedobacter aquatilis]|uniref:sensor histidine kinase n=1 Tax=Pedobacter aquatilis TaxID=351343 RepID=UPI002930E348|nr:ATP-binding protein [Pedobacter aquatilis]